MLVLVSVQTGSCTVSPPWVNSHVQWRAHWNAFLKELHGAGLGVTARAPASEWCRACHQYTPFAIIIS